MGDYNPHAPHILGEEWVPIRNEYTELSPLQTSVEYGHSFTTEASRTLYDSRFYVGEMPADVSETFYTTAIYAAGTEAQSGPVRSVIIPVDSVATTGTTQAAGSPPNGATALLTPSVDYYYTMSTQNVSAALGVMWIRYNVVPYQPLLDDKRILAVNVLFGASADLAVTPVVALTTDATNVVNARGNPWGSSFNNISRVAFGGDTTRFRLGNVALYNATTLLTDEYLPWTYEDIARFDASAGSPVYVAFSVGTFYGDESGNTANVWYSALEVIYCEEKRLYVGGWNNRVSSVLVNYGANVARMRDWQGKSLLPSMPAGDYTVTISSMNVGDLVTDPVDSALQLNACRELYSIPPHPGIQINVPYPPENAIGTEFTAEQAVILPQISLHTSGAAINEVHVYGRQAAAQVYGSITATQEIYDVFGQAADYPWVRFYARRFGDTTAPLTLTGAGGLSGSTVAITPDEFDALDEVVDGWKEITLRFDTPPSMGNSATPSWTWSAAGEDAGSRWEILAASAPALSGTAGNLFNAAAQSLVLATYYQPTGDVQELIWMPQGVASPYVSSVSQDDATDAALIFAQDQPTVTGFAVEAAVQELVGIGLDCGIDPCGIASGINYNRITWSPPPGTVVMVDTFTRVSSGWGTNDSGYTYTDSGGTVPGNYVVDGTTGSHVLDGVADVSRVSTVSGPWSGTHQRIEASINVVPAGASIRATIIGNFTDTSNYDFVDFRFATSGSLEIVIGNIVAGTSTNLTNVTVGAYGADQWWYLDADFSLDGEIRAKAWPVGNAEPAGYQAQATAAFSSGDIGLRSIRSSGNTNTDAVVSYEDYTVSPSTWTFGSYELQRSDEVTDWETIMLASDPAVTGFSDYEARTGLESTYRIRAIDLYGFYGAWSSEVSITLPSPGATGGDCLERGHLLLFTSNESQSGAYNLAYATIWEGRVTEDFTFVEPSFTQLQPMYDRDYFVAFRPTERGGVRFQRDLLVQAAAISPETLEDFTGLRDMAWADLSYVCVRDEEGNRWFATVLVPSGRVQLNRSLYMAVVDIVEVTGTPSQVDP